MEHLDYIDYPKFTFTLRKDGIVYYKTKPNVTINIDDIMEHYRYFEKKYANQKFLNIYEFADNSDMDDEVRKWASDPSGNNFTIADAFVINSIAQKLLGNFYITFHRPVKPTKLFNQMKDAEKWLKTFVKKNEK